MRKRFLCIFLCFGLCLPHAQAAEGGFSDVRDTDWFAPYAALCAEKGLMEGTGGGNFSPDGVLTQAECSTLALRLCLLSEGGDGGFETAPEGEGLLSLTLTDGTVLSGYAGEENPFSGWSWDGANAVPVTLPGETEEEKEAWGKAHEGPAVFHAVGRDWPGQAVCWISPNRRWEMYFAADEENGGRRDLSAAIQQGLLQGSVPGPDKWWRDAAYTAQVRGVEGLTFSSQSADRTFFVHTLAFAAGELEAINAISALPDTDDERVLAFYNAGILTGVDDCGTFAGGRTLTRAEAAAMAARILEPGLRHSFSSAQAERREYVLTEVSLPAGWVPTADSNKVAAGWTTIQRVEDEAVVEEAIYRADGEILSLDGYFVYGFEHLTSRGEATRLWVSTDRGLSPDLSVLYDALWNIYDVEQGQLLLEAGLLGDDPARDAAWQEYLSTPQTWPQPERDESAGLYGYVDREGNWVIPARYYGAGSFADGAAVVLFPDQDRSSAAIDETGKEFLPRRYGNLWYLGEGVFSYWGALSSWEGDDWRRDCGTVTMEGLETPTRAFSDYFNGGLAAHHGLVAVGHQADSNWVMTYYDLAGNQASEDFDWAGPIGRDGAGFVCKNGVLFRIRF